MSLDKDIVAYERHSGFNSQMKNPAAAGWQLAIKHLFDKGFSMGTLLMLSPLLLVLCLAIKLDSKGPIFFLQPRHGKDNRIFSVLKFRTMRVMEVGKDFKQAEKNDPRITRLGKFLRASSLDELPQLINVLIGDMSLVGRRPHPVALNRAFSGRMENFMERHCVRPGLTGLAQIRGHRGPTDTDQKMRDRLDSEAGFGIEIRARFL